MDYGWKTYKDMGYKTEGEEFDSTCIVEREVKKKGVNVLGRVFWKIRKRTQFILGKSMDRSLL